MRAASSELPGWFCRSSSFSRASASSRALFLRSHSGRRFQIDNRIAGGAELRSLVRRRHVPGAPVVRPAQRSAAVIGQHHERRQAGRFRSQTVGHPRTHAGEPDVDLARLHFVGRLHVIVRASVDRSDDGQLIDVPADVRKNLRDLDAALAVLLEREGAGHQRAREALPHNHVARHFSVDRLAGVFRQRRFRIPRVHLARPAAHEQGNHRFRARREVRRLGRVRIDAHGSGPARIITGNGRRAGQQSLLLEQVRQREPADASAGSKQEIAAVPEVLRAFMRHRGYLMYRNSFRFTITWVRSTSA